MVQQDHKSACCLLNISHACIYNLQKFDLNQSQWQIISNSCDFVLFRVPVGSIQTKIYFFGKKQISRSLQLLRVLCKKIFQFLFLFVLFLVGILLLSSRLRWFWAEHQWFTSLKWEQAKTEQFLKSLKNFGIE